MIKALLDVGIIKEDVSVDSIFDTSLLADIWDFDVDAVEKQAREARP